MDSRRIEELFEGLGPVTIRRLFGGKGIYHRGVIIAIVLHGELMLKADATTAPDFAAAGARQWTYAGKGREVAMPYWTVPDVAFDDPDEMTGRARRMTRACGRRRSKADPGRPRFGPAGFSSASPQPH